MGVSVALKSIKNFLKTRSLLSAESIEYIYVNYIEKFLLNEPLLCGLKRLRDGKKDKLCNQDNPIDRLDNDKKFKKDLENLEEELLEFAFRKNMVVDNQTLLEITKGKWALSFFVKKYLQVLKKLPLLCKNGEIISCDYCKEQNFEDCLYELKANYREEHIRADIINLTNLTSLTPIKERLKQLK